MIKIRYADLPGGLHARAEACGKDTIIYLLPGLTDAQRRAALHRARSSARIGHGPQLPATGVVRAVAADRVRTTVGNALAALRVHLGVSVPLVVIAVSAAIAYALLASGTVSGQSPQASGQTAALGTPVILAPWLYLGIRPRGPARHHRPALPRHPQPSGVIAPPQPQPSASPSPARSPSPTPRPTHRPKPSPTSSPTPVSSPSPAPTQTVPGSGSGSGSVGNGGGGQCLEFGPTGVCLAV